VGSSPKLWLWLHPHPSTRESTFERRINELRAAGISGILFLVSDSRRCYYPSSRLPMRANELERVARACQSAGLELHAWLFTLLCNVPEIQKDHPYWFVVNRNGKSTLREHPCGRRTVFAVVAKEATVRNRLQSQGLRGCRGIRWTISRTDWLPQSLCGRTR